MARPKQHIVKEKTITVHCSNIEYLLIKNASSNAKLSMSNFLRKAGLDIKIESKLTDEEVMIFRNVIGMANNINQIAKHVNTDGTLRVEMIQVLKVLTQLINKMQ